MSADHRHGRRVRSLPGERGDELLEGTVTIAFADIEESTRLVRRIGDTNYLDVVARISTAVSELADSCRALVPRYEGDGWMAVFGSARQAVRWAVRLEHHVEHRDSMLVQHGVRIRIGLHTGEAVQHGRDFGGQHVSLAARIAGTAAGGQVHVSAVTRTVVEGALDLRFGEPVLVHLKGFDEPHLVHRLDWSASSVDLDRRLDAALADVDRVATEAEE